MLLGSCIWVYLLLFQWRESNHVMFFETNDGCFCCLLWFTAYMFYISEEQSNVTNMKINFKLPKKKKHFFSIKVIAWKVLMIKARSFLYVMALCILHVRMSSIYFRNGHFIKMKKCNNVKFKIISELVSGLCQHKESTVAFNRNIQLLKRGAKESWW